MGLHGRSPGVCVVGLHWPPWLSDYAIMRALVHKSVPLATHVQRQPHGLQVIALQAVFPPCLGHQDGAVLSAVVLET